MSDRSVELSAPNLIQDSSLSQRPHSRMSIHDSSGRSDEKSFALSRTTGVFYSGRSNNGRYRKKDSDQGAALYDNDVHVLAGVVKSFLRDGLPPSMEPILPLDLYESFIAVPGMLLNFLFQKSDTKK